MIAIQVLFAIGSTAVLLVSVHMAMAATLWPLWLIKTVDGPGVVAAEPGLRKALRYTYIVFAVLGFGIAGYKLTETTLWWIPASIGSKDEYGDWISLTGSIAGTVAFFSAFGLPSLLHSLAARSVRKSP